MDQEMKVRLVADVAGFDTGLKQGIVLYDRFGKQISRVSDQVEGAVQQTQRSFNNLGRVSGAAGASVLSFSRIIQDAPFGIIGVGNNITQLVESFTALRASSKSTGAAVKSFFTSLIAPGNLLVLGISAITTAFTIFAMRARGAKKEVDDVSESFRTLGQILDEQKVDAEGEITRLDTLARAARNVNLSMDDRIAAVQELQSKYPQYFGSLTREDVLAGNVAGAYKDLTASIMAAAEARAYEKAAEEESNRRLSIRQNLIKALIDQAQAERQLQAVRERVAATPGGGGLLGGGTTGNQVANELSRVEQNLENARNRVSGFTQELRQSFDRTVEYGNKIQDAFEKADGAVRTLTGDVKESGDTARKAIDAISTDGLQRTSAVGEGLLKAAQSFDKGLSDAIARAAVNLSSEDFVKLINDAFAGEVSQLTVQPRLEIPEGTFKPLIDEARFASAEIGMLLTRSIGSGIENIFESIGRGEGISTVFDAITETIADFMSMLGKSLVATGLAALAFKKLLANPVAAIAAGSALIALSGLVRGMLSAGPGAESESTTRRGNFGPRPFADGGLVFGPTLGLVGEYPGARSNPEVIAPLNKLKDYIGDPGSQVVVMDVELSGDKLLLVQRRAERANKRYFG